MYSGEEVGIQAGWQKEEDGQGSAPLLEFLHGTSKEDQATFKRNMGPHGGDDVSSMEGDNPPVGVRVEDSAATPCL